MMFPQVRARSFLHIQLKAAKCFAAFALMKIAGVILTSSIITPGGFGVYRVTSVFPASVSVSMTCAPSDANANSQT